MEREKRGGIEDIIREVVDSANGPMFYMGTDGVYVYGNKAYESQRGSALRQIVENHAETVKMQALALAGNPVSRLGRVGERDVLLTVCPIRSGEESKFFLLCSLTELAMQQQVDDRTANTQYILRTMAHELKAPLSNMSLTLDLLAGECAREEKGEGKIRQLKRLKRQAFQLMELIDNFLDMARSKENMFEPFIERFELEELLDDIQDTIGPFAECKGIGWSVTRGPGLPEQIESDPEMVKRVILNFLSNACKFTEKGAIGLNVLSRGGSSVAFEITDSGCGIDEKELETIFKPFVRGSITGARTSGFGLGLSIARMFVNALGGQIEVESEIGKGSKFTLILPLSPNGETA